MIWTRGRFERTDDRVHPRPLSRVKNTKKWCRGKKGVEHKPVCRAYRDVKQVGGILRESSFAVGAYILLCTECGKELAWYWPPLDKTRAEQLPDWVTK